ncbi:MAG: T9SS type A sorting domain-containing protein [Rudanella sp.]|nr:T9SS type A sorting domain-containing protein [Rudanella sp.]
MITKSRTEIPGKDVPWVISQTSYIGANPNRRDLDNGGVSSALVRSGQSTGAIGLTGLYQMANTDDLLSNYRLLVGSDFPVHFNAAGAEIVAGRWADALKDICRNNRLTPITQQDLDTEPRDIVISESGQDLIAPAGYAGYKWLSGGASFDLNAYFAETQAISAPSARSIQTKDGTQIASSYKSAGTFQVVLQNNNGLPILTQSLDLPYVIVDDTQDNPPPTSGQCKNGNENSGGNRTPNGATVGGFGNSSEFMEYTFNVATGGNTNFSIRYASGDATAGIDLLVNGTPYAMRPAGTGSWTPNADASTTINLNAGNNTIRIQGSGNGNFAYDRLCIGIGGTPPPAGCVFSIAPTVSNPNPGCNAPLTLNANCSGNDCGGVSLAWSGNGQTYSGATPGITGPASNGTTTYSLTASKAGCSNQTGNVSVNVSGCVTTGLAISSAALNCGNGVVTLTMTGLNGNPVEYQAPGLQAWNTNPLVIPTWQRNNTSFTFYARQSGNNEASIGYTSSCAGYRMATSTEETAEGLWVSPNPTSGNVVARFTLNEGQRATLSVVNLSGQSLHSRAVVGTGKAQDETLDLSQQASGLYVVRLQTAVGVKTAKVILQR